jgi:hypothetical protein
MVHINMLQVYLMVQGVTDNLHGIIIIRFCTHIFSTNMSTETYNVILPLGFIEATQLTQVEMQTFFTNEAIRGHLVLIKVATPWVIKLLH